jgi:hypothetical protein
MRHWPTASCDPQKWILKSKRYGVLLRHSGGHTRHWGLYSLHQKSRCDGWRCHGAVRLEMGSEIRVKIGSVSG